MIWFILTFNLHIVRFYDLNPFLGLLPNYKIFKPTPKIKVEYLIYITIYEEREKEKRVRKIRKEEQEKWLIIF